LAINTHVWSLDFARDKSALAAGGGNGTVHVWDLVDGVPKERWTKKGHRQWANSVAFAPDGKTLLSTEGGASSQPPRYAILWNAADGTELCKWSLPERCSMGTFDPTGAYIALTNHNRKIYILRVSDLKK
jgi:WD40 repeat protein